MSLQASVWAIDQSVGDSSAKFILMVLADSAGVDHRIRINVERLAQTTELSPTAVRQALLRLQDLGLLIGDHLAAPELDL